MKTKAELLNQERISLQQQLLKDQQAILDANKELSKISTIDSLHPDQIQYIKQIQELIVQMMQKGPSYFCSVIAGAPVDLLKDQAIKGIAVLTRDDGNDHDDLLDAGYRSKMSIRFTSDEEDARDELYPHSKFGKLEISASRKMWTLRMGVSEADSQASIDITCTGHPNTVLGWSGIPKLPHHPRNEKFDVPRLFFSNGVEASKRFLIEKLGGDSRMEWLGRFIMIESSPERTEDTAKASYQDAIPHLVKLITESPVNQTRMSMHFLDSIIPLTSRNIVLEYLGNPPLFYEFLVPIE